MRSSIIFEPGGHAWFDVETKEWVALSYVRNLGRFKTVIEVREAIQKEVERVMQTNSQSKETT